MILLENDWYYDAALRAKRNTIKSAIDLVRDIEQQLNNGDVLIDENTMIACRSAIVAFKKAIEESNKAGQNMLELRAAKNKFFDVVDADASQDKKQLFEMHLRAQDYNEFDSERLNIALAIAATLAVIAITSVSLAAIILFPPNSVLAALSIPIFVFSAMGSMGAAAATAGYITDTLYNCGEQKRRDVVEDRAALSLQELNATLFFSTPTHATTKDPSSPPIASVVSP